VRAVRSWRRAAPTPRRSAGIGKDHALRDLQFVQPMDYPAVEVKVDAELAGASGITTEAVTTSLVAATSSSRFVGRTTGAIPTRASATRCRWKFQSHGWTRPLRWGWCRSNGPLRTPVVSARRRSASRRDRAGRIRPLQHEAPGEHDREHRRRGPRTSLWAYRSGLAQRRRAASRRDGRRARASGADATNVRRSGRGKFYEGLTPGFCSP